MRNRTYLPLDSGPHGGKLVHLADEPAHDLPDAFLGAVGVQLHEADVLLVGGQDDIGQADGLAGTDGEDSADVGVEGSSVAYLVEMESVAGPGGGLVRGGSGGLVECDDPSLKKFSHGTVGGTLAPPVGNRVGVLDQHGSDAHGIQDLLEYLVGGQVVGVDDEVVDAEVVDVYVVVHLVALGLGSLTCVGLLDGVLELLLLADAAPCEADLGTGLQEHTEGGDPVPGQHVCGEAGFQNYVGAVAGGLHDLGVDVGVDLRVLLRQLTEFYKGETLLCGKLSEDLSEDDGLEAEGLRQFAADSGLPGTGRTTDGYSHAPPASSILRRFLNITWLMSLFSSCPIGRLMRV